MPYLYKTHKRLFAWMLYIGINFTIPVAQAQLLASMTQPGRRPTHSPRTRVELRTVLLELMQHRQIEIIFDERLIEHKQVPSPVSGPGRSVEKVLNQLLNGTGLIYRRLRPNSYIIIERDSKLDMTKRDDQPVVDVPADSHSIVPSDVRENLTDNRPLASATQQDRPVSGQVTDEKGVALPGVSVVVKGTQRGTTTDSQGRFQLSVTSQDAVLLFSYVGYVILEQPVGSQSTVNVSMTPDQKSLGEVVVVGYGSQKKLDVTGAISTIKSEEINQMPITKAEQAMQGRAAGVYVGPANGQPGATITVRIRGIGTFNNSDPLYVIDGQVSNLGLDAISANDIESISVLKDASASAIYGSRAANGVVIVTTKRGTQGKARISFNAFGTYDQAPKILKWLNASQYVELVKESTTNAGKTDPYANLNPASVGAGTDWVTPAFQTGYSQNYNLSISGGSPSSTYSVSGNFVQQDGVLIKHSYVKGNLRFNGDYKVRDWLRFGNSIGLSRERYKTTDDGEFFVNAVRMSPLESIRNPDGSWGGFGFINPYTIANEVTFYTYNNFLQGNVYGEANFLKHLALRGSFGADYRLGNSSNFTPTYRSGRQGGIRENTTANLSRQFQERRSTIGELRLTYTNRFANKHNVTALVATTQELFRQEDFSGYRQGFFNNEPYIQVLSAGGQANQNTSGGITEWRLRSYLGRVDYNLSDKYLFNAGFRYDGSSRFAPEKRWGFFPFASGGWVMSAEPFMQSVRRISLLKLRVGYGELGNQNLTNNYPYQSIINLNQNYVFGNNNVVTGGAPTSVTNRDIQWERSVSTNVGVDLGLLNNQVELSADYYIRDTKGILGSPPIPGTVGASAPLVNSSSMRNQGIEFLLTYRKKVKDWSFEATANYSYTKNRVTALGQGRSEILGNNSKTVVGQPYDAWWVYNQLGIFQNQAEVDAYPHESGARPGSVKWEDANGDGQITPADRKFVGQKFPTQLFGFRLSATYRNFDFTTFFQGEAGKLLYRGPFGLNTVQELFNASADMYGRWHGEGTSNRVPILIDGDPLNNFRAQSSYYLSSSDYLKLKNLQIGYTLSKAVSDKMGLSRLRVYIGGQNLVRFTGYQGWDPETSQAQEDNRYTTFPMPRSLMAGINLGF